MPHFLKMGKPNSPADKSRWEACHFEKRALEGLERHPKARSDISKMWQRDRDIVEQTRTLSLSVESQCCPTVVVRQPVTALERVRQERAVYQFLG